MRGGCLLYYITDRRAFPGHEFVRRQRLLGKIAEAARCGVDYIQLREKDLPTRDLESLAKEAMSIIAKARIENRELKTAFLINSRTDVALAVEADGVHLRSDDVSPEEVRKIWTRGGEQVAREGSSRNPVIAVSCHSPADVVRAAKNGADFAVFAPIFEKKDAPGAPAGLMALKEVCRAEIPVFALGGITLGTAHLCLDAGAAGIAGIRLFQENDIAEVVSSMNGIPSR
jgi:thiamine-phosphate pyrophosphorylase